MPHEVCFLIGPNNSLLWSDASDDPRFMPDSRERWERIWAAREQLVEIAHTHPLGGLHFSATDNETMTAINAGLGRALVYSVITPEAMLRRTPQGTTFVDAELAIEPWWTTLIRVASSHTLDNPIGDSE